MKFSDFLKGYRLALPVVTAVLFGSVITASIPVHAVEPSLSSATVEPPEVVTDRIIVKYKSSMPSANMAVMPQNAIDRVSQVAGHRLAHVRQLATGAQVLKLQQRTNRVELEAIINRLRQDPQVEYAEPDRIMQVMATPNDTYYNQQWHYFESTGGLNLPPAWDVTQGEGVVVGVIDTGYRPHADLAANILPGYDMISDTTVAQDGNGRDSDASDPGDWSPAGACGSGQPARDSSWHGTHVAGTIAAVTNNGTGVAGVAYKAKVVPIRALGRCGGYTSDIADGIIWGAGGSVSGVPSNPNPAQVLNLSLGGGGSCDTTTQNAINTARSLGTTVVVAAGNSNANAGNFSPASCSGVVTVASTNRAGGRAYYSNYGSVVDVAAPGGETSVSSNGVLSTLNSGSQGPGSDNYEFYQGTSMAAPHVAGAAALLYAVDGSLTPAEVESLLVDSARSFPAGCSGCGAGIVDAAAAVAAVSGDPGPGPGNGELQNGVPETNLSGNSGSELFFTLEVPAGASNLTFQISGGSGDADLYVQFGSAPTTSSYACRPYLNGNNETCSISNVQAGTYHVMLRGYTSFSGVTLVGSFDEDSGGSGASGWTESNLSGNSGAWQHFTLEVNPGMATLDVLMSGGSGDADLYVRFGSQPTTSSYDCRPYRWGNDESCSFSNPQSGTWYISIRGYDAYSGVTLEALASP
ncbi:Extracellular basic protease precursor [Microbulbifer aggregans]|uniref:Extracellular basic protease n=1 Tax=Microbulbifer aggregans TaxID=1769779 RepID=A0A1C9W583_9GAMM|nr:S8 family peptidase [Microbulbifer aggregans]AOS96287.1 Extracellular basic protease precursor [Microbulbifer aggregans]